MFHTAFIQINEICKLLVPGVESQAGIYQVDMFTVEYGTVFIDLMNMKLNF